MQFKKSLLGIGCMFVILCLNAAPVLVAGSWRGVLVRRDGVELPFNFIVSKKQGQQWVSVKNASEKLPAVPLQLTGDSLQFELPFFEGNFRFKLQKDGSLKGWYLNYTSSSIIYWEFRATPHQSNRFLQTNPPKFNISGRWALAITRANGTLRPALAEWKQQGAKVSGTILTPSGDYRYLEGIVFKDTLLLSGFNGGQAYLVKAHLKDTGSIDQAVLYSGYAGLENWKGEKNSQASLPDVGNVPRILEANQPLDFSFPDTDSMLLSLKDKRFEGKLVLVQAMGSWCPNCMDESIFLNDLYRKYRSKGLEVVGLAYELSSDFERSRKSLLKLKKQWKIEYPYLITGVAITDSLRTQKTIPQISPIKVFPTLIVIGTDKKIKYVEAGFYGPGAGIHYELHKKELETKIEKWLEK